MNLQKNLAELTERLRRMRTDLRIIEEQLLFQLDVVEDARTRMLVAETPLGDREYDVARDDYERMNKERSRLLAGIHDAQLEQDALLDRMLGSHA